MILSRPDVRGWRSAPLRRERACSGKVHGRTKPVRCARPDPELCGLLLFEPCPRPGNHYPNQGVPGSPLPAQALMQGAGDGVPLPWLPPEPCLGDVTHTCARVLM